MAENKSNPENFHSDISPDWGDAEFDPLLASHFELSHEMTRMAGDHNITDITDDRHLTQWDTKLEGVHCELTAWDFPDEPSYMLIVHSGKDTHTYEYGNYVTGIRYSSNQNHFEKPTQEVIEARLTALLQYGHKQLVEAEYGRTFDEITGRLALERVLERSKNARRLFNQALAQKSFNATSLQFLTAMHDREDWSVRHSVFHKAATDHLEERVTQNIMAQPEPRTFRRLLERFKPQRD